MVCETHLTTYINLLLEAIISVSRGPFCREPYGYQIHSQMSRVQHFLHNRRVDVASLLTKVLKRIKPSSITNGFLATGLYPLDPNKPDYSKCLEIDRENEGNDVVPIIEDSTPVAIAASTSREQTDSATSRFETALEVVEELFGNDVEDYEKVKLSDLV